MYKICLLTAALLLFPNLIRSQPVTEIADCKSFFDKYDVSGCFIMYDLKNDKKIVYNPDRCDSGYLPASTFKIPHALIALETGTAKDKNFTLRWDKQERFVKSWNRDHTLESAIQNSVVWYFVKMSELIGLPVLEDWLKKLDYGNADVSGDQPFWLRGNLRITPNEQIEFINDFYHERLPFSKENIRIVKDAILIGEGEDYKLYAKTGWVDVNDISIGWTIGYLQIGAKTYLFVNNVQSEIDNDKFGESRIAISKSILSEYTGVSLSEN